MLQRQYILLILCLTFALRLYGLGDESLWYDETVSAVLAQKSMGALLAHTARDIHPPGYYLFLHFWGQMAGFSAFSLAYFSLGWSLILMALVYRLGRWLLGAQVAGWAMVLLALSPYQLWYAQEVRMYTLGASLGLASVYFLLRGLTTSTRWAWLGYTLSAFISLYTLYYLAFLLIVINLLAIWQLYQVWRQEEIFSASLKAWLGFNILAAIAYLPWLPIAWRQAINPPVPPWRSHIPLVEILSQTWLALSLGESITLAEIWPLTLLTLVLYGLGVWQIKSTRWRIWFIVLTFGPLFMIWAIPLLTKSPLFHVRYMFTYAPAFYLVLGSGLEALQQKSKYGANLVLMLIVAGSAFSSYQFHNNSSYASDDLQGAVAQIEANWRPGDVIFVNAGYTYTAFQYYFEQPVLGYQRLSEFDPAETPTMTASPLILQSGTVDGPPELGWGDPQSDFYAISQAETAQALEAVSQQYHRIWMLRAYDTVGDAKGFIRAWLAENTLPIADHPVSGPSNMRVQGFLGQVGQPPIPTAVDFGGLFWLRGFMPPGNTYQAGQAVDVALWLEAQTASQTPYALSLKLWDEQGLLAAQQDEWPLGNVYFSPDWETGRLVRHPMRLYLPINLASGSYWLDVQLYNTNTGQALELPNEGGNSFNLWQIGLNP